MIVLLSDSVAALLCWVKIDSYPVRQITDNILLVIAFPSLVKDVLPQTFSSKTLWM